MAKKKVFGEEARKRSGGQRKMAKVIISTKTDKNNYAFKETMVDQDDALNYIQKKQA